MRGSWGYTPLVGYPDNVLAGDAVGFNLFSPGSALDGNPFILVFQVYDTAIPIPGVTLPGDLATSAWFTPVLPFYAFDNLSVAIPFGPQLVPGGFNFGPLLIPSVLGTSGKSVMVQLYASDPGRNAVNLGSSAGQELRIF